MRSPDGRGVVATWEPKEQHAASAGVLNGGIVGALLDCHSAAAVFVHALEREGKESVWATAEYTVRLMRPTPPDAPLELFAEVIEFEGDRAVTSARLTSTGKVRATCDAVFKRFQARPTLESSSVSTN